MTELKPCPFCGGDSIDIIPADIIAGTQYWRIYCYYCGCTQTPVSNKEDAIETWNNRPNPWHKGVPQEEGWFLVKYKWTGGEGFPNKFTYRAVKNQRLRNGTILFTELEPSSEYWEPIEYQKLDDKEASK